MRYLATRFVGSQLLLIYIPGLWRLPLCQPASASAVTPVNISESKVASESCPVTKPPAPPFVPPAPYPRTSSPTSSWFGTNRLWLDLGKDGRWQALPRWADGTYRQLLWRSEGYDWRTDRQPNLMITGKLLDCSSAALQTDDQANNGWIDDSSHPFIVTGINIPALGC